MEKMKLLRWLFGPNSVWCKLTHWCYEKKTEPVPVPIPPPAPPPDPEWPQAPDYDGQLIGTTAYSLIRYPIEEIEWFLREIVAAGGNATEALSVTTWDNTHK